MLVLAVSAMSVMAFAYSVYDYDFQEGSTSGKYWSVRLDIDALAKNTTAKTTWQGSGSKSVSLTVCILKTTYGVSGYIGPFYDSEGGRTSASYHYSAPTNVCIVFAYATHKVQNTVVANTYIK